MEQPGAAASERIAALERRWSDLVGPAPRAAVVDPVPATHEALIERAKMRGNGPHAVFENWPAVLAEEIAVWEAAAARAIVPADRVRAWSELERLYGMTRNREAMNLVQLSILEMTGLKDESAWKRARLLANSEWGNGDLAVASSLYREIGLAADLPKEQAVAFRAQAAQLAVAGSGPAHAIRLYREFLRDYEGDSDPKVVQSVAWMRRALATLEARHPELRGQEE